MKRKKIKIGLVGLGFISDVHIEAYRRRDDVFIKALSDSNQSLLLQKAETLGIKETYPDYNFMLNDKDIDVIDVMTPHFLHKECVLAALDKGKTVICEKPLTTNSKDVTAIETKIKQTQKNVYVKQYLRQSLAYKKAYELITSDTLGKVYFVQCLFTGNSTKEHLDPKSWRGNKQLAGGGILMDIGVHIIDMLQSFFGSPQAVYGRTKRIASPLQEKGEDFATAVFEFPHDLIVNLGATQCDTGYKFRWEIRFYGTRGVMTVIDHSRDLKELQVIKNKEVVYSFQETNWWQDSNIRALNTIIDAISRGSPPPISLREAKTVIKTIEAIYSADVKKTRIITS